MNSIYDNEEYRQKYSEMIESFGRTIKYRKKPYSIFVPHIGSDYGSTELMICGRAGNGGHLQSSADYMKKASSKILDTRIRDITTEWMIDHRQSPFINVARDLVIGRFGFDQESWHDKFAWSNLMKIAPFKGGNPGSHETKVQSEYCRDIFKLELQILRPRNLVLITDFWWSFDFLEYLGIEPAKRGLKGSFKYIKAQYQYNGTNIIVAKRPEFQKRKNYVDSVIGRMK